MMELCDISRKRKELMWKLNQPGSELDEAPHTSSNPFTALTAISEHENTIETLDTRRSRPLRLTQMRPSFTAKESWISYSSAEKKANFRYPEEKDDLCFSAVETPTESHKSDAVKSSSDKEIYSFDDGSTRPDPFQKRQLYRMKVADAEPYSTSCDTVSPLPRDEKKMCGEEIDQERQNTRGRSVYQSSYPFNQANLRNLSQCQASYSPKQARSYSPNTNIQRTNLLHQVQDRNETCPSRKTISSSLNLQKNTQREEMGSPKGRNACRNRVVTTLPSIQQRTRNTPVHSRKSHAPAEQRSEVLPYARRYGRQEVSEVRNSEYRMSRRHGVCKETDTTQEQRTFVRVLGKRF